jgi:hypothetical protein
VLQHTIHYNHAMLKRTPVIEIIDDEMAELLRHKTPAQSLAAAHDMWRYGRRRLMAQVHREHPEWGQTVLNEEVCRRLLGSG